jgi:phosphoglycolate phosphatase-like HAD superfamily hydrolase
MINAFDYKAIIFDFDGVIVDSIKVKGDAFCELYSEYSNEIRNEIKRYHNNNGGISRVDKIRYFETTLLKNKLSEKKVIEKCSQFSEIVSTKVAEAAGIPGALDFIKKYSGKIPCFLNSATPDIELKIILEKKGIHDYFSGVYGSSRSKEENLVAILDVLGITEREVIFFGDALTDYLAAKKVNVDFCAVTFTSSEGFKQVISSEKEKSISDFLSL